jgi:hypothetical protein
MIAWLKVAIALGLALGAVLTGLGRLAEWWPALDIVNDGLPFLAAGTVLLFVLARARLALHHIGGAAGSD